MAERDFTHLTPDEKINGIKASKLPDHIRSKYHGEDVREALAQSTEMAIQLGINMGLSPDDALSWARKLQQAVPRSEFDSWVATLLDGGPSIFMNTLSELQATYPNGAAGVALVRETDPAKIYVWNGSAWEDFGDYQGIEIKDNSITSSKIADGAISPSKLQGTSIPITKPLNNPSEFPNYASDWTKLYIAKDSLLQNGIVNLKGKFSAGTFDFYLLKKTGLTFTVLKRVTKTVEVGGVQTVMTDFYASGSGDEYIGLIGPFYYINSGGTGIYEKANAVKDAASFTAVSSSASLNLGFYPIYENVELAKQINANASEIEENSVFKPYGDFGIKDFSTHDFVSSYKKIYVPNEVLKAGDLTIHIKAIEQDAIFYVLEKSGLNFTVLKAKKVNLIDGENIIDMEYSTSGNGSEYFGYYAIGYYKKTGGKGFYETGSEDATYDYATGQTITTIDSTIGTPSVYDLGVYPEYQTKIKDEISKLNTEFAQLNDDFNSLPSLTSQPSINLTDYKTPQYSEISEPVGFVGRWFDKTINGFDCKVTINQGSEFYFKVKGTTTVNVNFELNSALQTPYFAYSIDGGAMIRQLITNPTLPAVNTDEHIVRVVIDGITESEDKWIGEKGVAFNNITVDAGGTVTGILPKNRKIMFFGDSITEGVRVLNMEATANGNSGSGAYPFVTCENLNAISYRVGFGSQGVTNGGSGGVPEVLPMLDLMTSTRPVPYYEPDLIVLNHGTNDGPGTSEDFIAKYNAVLDRLTIKYAGVPIFAMVPFRKNRETEIRQCVAGRSNVYLVETGDWPITYTDGTHPDLNGGVVAGQKLAESIISVVGKQFFI